VQKDVWLRKLSENRDFENYKSLTILQRSVMRLLMRRYVFFFKACLKTVLFCFVGKNVVLMSCLRLNACILNRVIFRFPGTRT